MAAPAAIDLDDLVEHWTVLDDERTQVAGKRGATRLGFALLLKFYTRHGRFPATGSDLPGAAVEFVVRQVQVTAEEFGSYEWAGRSIEHRRAQIREHLGFRECSVADAEQLTAWLVEHVTQIERRPEASAASCSRAVAANGSSRRLLGGSIGSSARPFVLVRTP